ncbi:MAG TPA: VOC family protein [Candidatus Paceibacterota bacterium]|jgi:predicted enzyme related to lactoylglutathione lyase|nr:VOC family protein [Candidatus Paceibacterota bacterium]
MKIKEIAFAAYAVTDVKRARAFYEGTLGLKPNSVMEQGNDFAFIEYWLGEKDEHCLVIGAGAPQFKPGKMGATVALEVDDFKAWSEKLKGAGVKFLMEPYDGSSCSMTLIEDPDGNQIMIHQRKPKV